MGGAGEAYARCPGVDDLYLHIDSGAAQVQQLDGPCDAFDAPYPFGAHTGLAGGGDFHDPVFVIIGCDASSGARLMLGFVDRSPSTTGEYASAGAVYLSEAGVRQGTRSGAVIALTTVAPGRALMDTEPLLDKVYEGSFEIHFDEATTLRGSFRACAITDHSTLELDTRLRAVFAPDDNSSILD